MQKYDLEKLSKCEIDNNTQTENSSVQEPQKPKYSLAFLAGLGTSVIIAIILSLLAVWLEAEYWYVLVIGAVIVSLPIKSLVPNCSMVGAIMGFILCPLTYFLYQIILSTQGYYYESDGESTFWFMLLGSAVAGAYLGYNKEDND